MRNSPPSATVAEIILDQLGGVGRLVAMTGAKQFAAAPDGVTFRIGRNAHKVTACSVRLDPCDTYTVTFYTGHGINMKPVREGVQDQVYAEDLIPLFERVTGMYLTFANFAKATL